MARFISLILLFHLSTLAHADFLSGSETGNGGDPIEQEFESFGRAAYVEVAARAKDFSEIDLKKLEAAIANTSVTVVTKILLDNKGKPRTALNFSKQKLIQVNKDLWKEMDFQPPQKMAVALHEYLGIIELEQGHYNISSRLNQPQLRTGVDRFSLLKSGCRYGSDDPGTFDVVLKADPVMMRLYTMFMWRADDQSQRFGPEDGMVYQSHCSSLEGKDCPMSSFWKDRATNGYTTILPDGSLLMYFIRQESDGSVTTKTYIDRFKSCDDYNW